MQVPIDTIQFLTRFRYMAQSCETWGENEIDYGLLMRSDAPPRPNPDEVDRVRYVTPAELERMLGERPHLPRSSRS